MRYVGPTRGERDRRPLVRLGRQTYAALYAILAGAGTSVLAAAGSLLVMFIWLVFADISHHSTLRPFFVFGVARIACEAPIDECAVQAAQPPRRAGGRKAPL